MLVLSRRVDESILFPELGISIDVLQLRGNTVRIGVDAPVSIKVLRGELHEESASPQQFDLNGKTEHEVRNKLNSLSVASAYAKKLVERGEFNLAASMLFDVLSELAESANNYFEEGEIVEDFSASPLKALLVEDVDNEREMLAGFLRLHGMRVSSVANVECALNHLQANATPDFMMVDIGLPGKSGADLIHEVRADSAFDDVKLFAISGQTPEEARVNPTANRIAKWFQKPLEPSRLISEIEHSMMRPERTAR